MWFVGLAIGFFALYVLIDPLLASWHERRRDDQVEERFADAPVREVRNPDPTEPTG